MIEFGEIFGEGLVDRSYARQSVVGLQLRSMVHRLVS